MVPPWGLSIGKSDIIHSVSFSLVFEASMHVAFTERELQDGLVWFVRGDINTAKVVHEV